MASFAAAQPSSLVITTFVFFFLLTSSSVLCNTPATQQQIDKICNGIFRPPKAVEFCRNTFNALKGPSTDVRGLAQIAIDKSLASSIDDHDFILSMLGDTRDPTRTRLLVFCEEAYVAIVGAIQDASQDFSRSDYKRTLGDLQRVGLTQVATCMRSSEQLPGNPMGERNWEMDVLIWMSIVATSELVNP